MARAAGRSKKPEQKTPGPKKPEKLPKAERRQQILGAARDVFARRGYHQSTIDDIVAEAGVARGTFYLYFEDKRAIFSDLIDRFAQQLTMAIVRIDPEDAARTVSEQVRENIRRILSACLSERTMTKMLFTDAMGVDPAFDRKIQSFYDAVVQLLTESLKDGQTLGIVTDGEPRVLAYLTIGALKELLYQAVTLGLAEESAEVLDPTDLLSSSVRATSESATRESTGESDEPSKLVRSSRHLDFSSELWLRRRRLGVGRCRGPRRQRCFGRRSRLRIDRAWRSRFGRQRCGRERRRCERRRELERWRRCGLHAGARRERRRGRGRKRRTSRSARPPPSPLRSESSRTTRSRRRRGSRRATRTPGSGTCTTTPGTTLAATRSTRPVALVTTLVFDGPSEVDWEDMEVGPGPTDGASYLYFADIGDNDLERESVVVIRALEPSIDPDAAPEEIDVDFETLVLEYPDGPHNAETLLLDPDTLDLFIVTKGDAAGSEVFVARGPQSTNSVNALDHVGTLPFGVAPLTGDTLATSGDISADGRQILLRTYDSAFWWARPAGVSVEQALTMEPCAVPIA